MILATVKECSVETSERDRRTGRRIGYNGCVIRFSTKLTLTNNQIVRISYLGAFYWFEVKEVKAKEDWLHITAPEIGYFMHKSTKLDKFDPRKLIGLDIVLVTDNKETERVWERSFWC